MGILRKMEMLEMVGRYVEVEKHHSHSFDGSSEYLVVISEEGVVKGMVTGSFEDVYPETYVVIDIETGLQQFIDESLLTPLDKVFEEESNLRGKDIMVTTQYEEISSSEIEGNSLPHGLTKGTVGTIGAVLPSFDKDKSGVAENKAYFVYTENDIVKGAFAQFLGKDDFTLL